MNQSGMQRRVRLLTVCVLLIAVILCGNMILSRMDGEVALMKSRLSDVQKQQYIALKDMRSLEDEVAISSSDEYIASLARTEHGFLRPGEVRYEVVNLDALFGEQPLAQAE